MFRDETDTMPLNFVIAFNKKAFTSPHQKSALSLARNGPFLLAFALKHLVTFPHNRLSISLFLNLLLFVYIDLCLVLFLSISAFLDILKVYTKTLSISSTIYRFLQVQNIST